MKENIHTKSTFKTEDIEKLKRAVTEKVERLVNRRIYTAELKILP